MQRILFVGLIGCAFGVAGCSTSEQRCTPGVQQACSCDNGATGSQTCSASQIFSSCVCESTASDAGTMDAEMPMTDAGPTDSGSDATRPRPDGSVILFDGGFHADSGTTDAGPECVFNADCDDDSVCTTDSCVLGSCSHASIACDDSDPCTNDSCDPTAGCMTAPRCDDGIDCTADSCVMEGTLWVCHNNASNALCNDGNSSTTDLCVVSDDGTTGGCLHAG